MLRDWEFRCMVVLLKFGVTLWSFVLICFVLCCYVCCVVVVSLCVVWVV